MDLKSLTLRQKEILTGATLFTLFFGSFLLGEGALRATQAAKFGVEKSVETSKKWFTDPETGLRLPVPGRKMGRIQINSLGFRGPDIPLQKEHGTIRLAFLGSSTTYDADVAEGKNWPHLTTKKLQAAFPECRFDFANAGLPGFGTEHMLRYYQNSVRNLAPDVVLILPGDVNQDLDWLAEERGFDATHYRPSRLAEASVLWAKLEKNFVIIERQRTAHIRDGKLPVEVDLLRSRFESRLSDLVKEVQADDGTMVALLTISSQLRREQSKAEQLLAANTSLFYMPHVAIPDVLDTRDEYNDAIRSVANNHGAILVGNQDFVPGDRIHYVDTMHFSPAGSELMADRVSRELARSSAFRDLLARKACSKGSG